jgi:hypothetical protein
MLHAPGNVEGHEPLDVVELALPEHSVLAPPGQRDAAVLEFGLTAASGVHLVPSVMKHWTSEASRALSAPLALASVERGCCTLEMATRPFGTSANFKPAHGDEQARTARQTVVVLEDAMPVDWSKETLQKVMYARNVPTCSRHFGHGHKAIRHIRELQACRRRRVTK